MTALNGHGKRSVRDLVMHRAPLTDGAPMHELFQKKEDGSIKVVLTP